MDERMFILRDDRESAKVRILLNSWDEIQLRHVHEVKVKNDDGDILRTFVKCAGDDCPLCKIGVRLDTRVYIPLYNEETKKNQLWERTRLSYQIFEHIFNKYSEIPKKIFEITRYGHPGDRNTTYRIDFVEDTGHLSVCDYAPDPEEVFYQELSLEELNKLAKDWSIQDAY